MVSHACHHHSGAMEITAPWNDGEGEGIRREREREEEEEIERGGSPLLHLLTGLT